MGGYTNGNWPESMFEVYATGKDEDGPWKHLLTTGTRVKIDRLKELAHKRTGRRLEISPGWSCYRPIGPQRTYRARYGMGAAYPGTSSHGINWLDGDRGWRVCLAIDFHNWGWVYGWDRDAWYADVRAAGLEPGLIHPSRGNGYPDEPWHVIDLEPFKNNGSSGGAGSWDEMATKQEIKDALYEVLIGTKLGPGGRNHWDSLKFIADIAAQGTAEKVWGSEVVALDENGNPRRNPDGSYIKFKAWGFMSSTTAQVEAHNKSEKP